MSALIIDVDPKDEATATDAVARWMLDRVTGLVAPLRFSRVAGGHSCITFIVSDAAGTKVVLRRPPLGHVLASAHDVLREHRIMHALRDTDVPVPRMLGACSDTDVLDAPFYVMECVEGVVLHDAASVATLLPDLAARRTASESMVDAMVALHRVVPDEVGLGDLSRASGYLDRQLKRWYGQWTASKTASCPTWSSCTSGWSPTVRPSCPPASCTATSVSATRCTRPTARCGPSSTGSCARWAIPAPTCPTCCGRGWDPRSRRSPPSRGPRAGGFLSRAELVARYEVGTGTELTDLDYWQAFHAWRSAAIVEGVYRRYVDGQMGQQPVDMDAFARSVELGAQAGMVAAGLAG